MLGSQLKICVSIALAVIAVNAHAEYYLVYPAYAPYFDCYYFECRQPCPQYLHFSSPHRHNHRGSGEMQEYGWVGDP